MRSIIWKKWTVIVGLGIVWMIGTILYCKYIIPDNPKDSTWAIESGKFTLLALSGYGILFTVLLSSFNSLEATQNMLYKIKWDKTENSFGFMERWDSPSIKQARDISRTIRSEHESISIEELIHRVDSEPDLKRSVITMLNFFEEMYLSILADRVDENWLKVAFLDVYKEVYAIFGAWIQRQEDTQKKNLQYLNSRWQRHPA